MLGLKSVSCQHLSLQAVIAITNDDFDLLGVQGIAKTVFPEVFLTI